MQAFAALMPFDVKAMTVKLLSRRPSESDQPLRCASAQ